MNKPNTRIVLRRGATASTVVLVLLLLVVTALAAYLIGAKTNGDIWNRDQPSERMLRRAGLIQIDAHGGWDPLRKADRAESRGTDWQGVAIQQRTHAGLLSGPALIARVMANPNSPIRATNWYKSYNNDAAKAKHWLEKHLRAEPIADSQLVRVFIDDDSLPGMDAKIIIENVVNRHLEEQQSLNTTLLLDRTTTLNNLRQKYEARKLELQDKRNRRLLQLNLANVGNNGVPVMDLQMRAMVQKQTEFDAAAIAAQARLDRVGAKVGAGNPDTPELIEARTAAETADDVAKAFAKRMEKFQGVMADYSIAMSDYLSTTEELTALDAGIKNVQDQLDAISAGNTRRQVEWAQRPELDNDAG